MRLKGKLCLIKDSFAILYPYAKIIKQKGDFTQK